PSRVCVAGGANKVTAIRATMNGGYATHLVTDIETAEMLLAEGV
ncbi:MAG: sugar-binding domain-containing protein, partial [Ensifer adhaerens]